MFFQRPCHLRDNVEKYGRAREASNDNIIKVYALYMLYTHSEYVILLAFAWQQWLHTPEYYTYT